MGTLAVTFAFPSDAQSFTATTGANTVGSWQSADGTPSNGCLQLRISGRNKTNANNLYSRTLTFEDMGVPAGSTVTGITSGSAYYRCREWLSGSSTGNIVDYVTLTPSGQSAITIAGASSLYSNTSSWAQRTGTNSTGLSLASSTSCVIAWQADLSTTNNSSAAVTLACDLITFTVTYTSPASASATTVVGTGAAGTATSGAGVGASVSSVVGSGAVQAVTVTTPTTTDVNASAPTLVATGSAGTMSATTAAATAVSGVGATGSAGAIRVQDSTGGSIPIFSLNLGEFAQSDTAYKWSADTFRPVLTEDSVDSITIEMFDRFAPRLEGAGIVQLSGGIVALINGVAGDGAADDVSVGTGVSAVPFGVQALGDPSNFVRPTGKANVTLTGVSRQGRVGAASVNAGGATTTELADVDATGSAGTITVTVGCAAAISGVAGTSAAGTMSQTSPVTVSLTGTAGTGAIEALVATGDASFSVAGVYSISSLGAVISNPGREGSDIRRAHPGKGPRTVRVGR